MKKLLRLWIVSAVCLFAFGLAQAKVNKISGFRVWHGVDSSYLILNLDGRIDYQVERKQKVIQILLPATLSDEQFTLSKFKASEPFSRVELHNINGRYSRLRLTLKDNYPARHVLLAPNEEYGYRLILEVLLPDKDVLKEFLLSKNKQANKKSSPPVKKKIIVAIDAGHGGEDPGAIGYKKIREKQITFAIASQLEKELKNYPQVKTLMIREGDYYVELYKRTLLSQIHQADAFISIHANKFTSPKVRGAIVFALSTSGASSQIARLLVQKENRSDTVAGVINANSAGKSEDIKHILSDLTVNFGVTASSKLGTHIIKRLGKVTKMHSPTVERAGFAVLKNGNIPSVLVETGFISNKQEAINLSNKNYQKKIARAISLAIGDYFGIQKSSARQPSRQTQLGSKPASSARKKLGTTKTASKTTVQKAKLGVYKVVSGDTLGGIAWRHATSIKQLQQINNLRDSRIYVGLKLKVPIKNYAFYQVVRGDSLSKIAQRHQTSVKELKKLNSLTSNKIYSGLKLKIPK